MMNGNIVGGKRAKLIGLHLGKLETRHNKLTPRIVVDDARDPKSPLHSCFEWDNSKAAEQYRLWQARHLMGTVKIIYDHAPQDSPPVRHIVNVRREISEDDIQREYMTTARALSDPELRAQLLDRARREVVAWRDRYRALTELAVVFKAIDKIPKQSNRRKSA